MPQTIAEVRKQMASVEDIVVELSAPTAVVICALADAAKKRGDDRSFEYWLEECIISGAKAFERSWDYSDTAKDAREFKKAISNSKIRFTAGVPATIQDQIGFAELCVKFHQYDVTMADVISLKESAAKAAEAAK